MLYELITGGAYDADNLPFDNELASVHIPTYNAIPRYGFRLTGYITHKVNIRHIVASYTMA